MHILIVGAGLGGLALGHGLKKAGIAFHIYERDPTATYRPQGYRIRISPQGAEALAAVLTSDHFRHFELACAHPPRQGVNLEAISGQPAEVAHKPMLPRPTNTTYSSYTADRIETRNVLLQGLEEHISFGKELVRFTPTRGGVEASFKDGSVANGTLLVGADGVRSCVRRQHFPTNVAPIDTQGRAIYGKSTLTPPLEALLGEEVRQKTCLVQDRTRPHVLTLFTEAIRFDGSNGVSHPLDYIYWVLVADRSVYEAMGIGEVSHLTTSDAAAAAQTATAEWDVRLRAIIDHQDPGNTSGLRICSTVPDRLHWEANGRVTALGDSIHVAPPAGGQGANMALRDAAALTQVLTDLRSGVGGATLLDAIRKYEEDMRSVVEPALGMSLAGGRWMFDQKPYEECAVAEF